MRASTNRGADRSTAEFFLESNGNRDATTNVGECTAVYIFSSTDGYAVAYANSTSVAVDIHPRGAYKNFHAPPRVTDAHSNTGAEGSCYEEGPKHRIGRARRRKSYSSDFPRFSGRLCASWVSGGFSSATVSLSGDQQFQWD